MMFRRKIRRLHRAATACWVKGTQWDSYTVSAPPEGPCRIAFDAGLEAARKGRETKPATYPDRRLPLEVWSLVLADYLRRDKWDCY